MIAFETDSTEESMGEFMNEIPIEEAQARLSQLIDGLTAGGEIIITRDARPVAQLIGPPADKPLPVLGRGRGKLIILEEDEEHLDGFEEDMP